jgi:ABC-type branched-subunit amino acid transport system substrate-binding protein
MNPLKPFNSVGAQRRSLLQGLALGAAGAWAGTPLAWAQPGKPASTARGVSVAQVVDMSASQIDVSKDFLIGARAAWTDINSKGGVRGLPVQHLVLETDGTPASTQRAIETLRATPNCIAAFGTVGSLSAQQLSVDLLKQLPDLPHIAPWLQDTEGSIPESTFPIFAGRREQMQHALKTLSTMGIDQVGVVFGNPVERVSLQPEIERMTRSLAVRPVMYPANDLQRLGQSFGADTPRVLLFVGGTPELLALAQGIGKQAQQRYVVALSDVNVLTLQQSGLSRHVAVIATQVVPLVNGQATLVRQYRDTMGRLYDEPPTPQSLAGFTAARYTYETLRQVEGGLSRATVMAGLQQRKAMDLGGFQVSATGVKRSGSFVTQSMLASDGRFIG